jgi:hypothetical protein
VSAWLADRGVFLGNLEAAQGVAGLAGRALISHYAYAFDPATRRLSFARPFVHAPSVPRGNSTLE